MRWCSGREYLDAVWEFDGALAMFAQYNANAAPGNAQNSEMELRGTKGTQVHPLRPLGGHPRAGYGEYLAPYKLG